MVYFGSLIANRGSDFVQYNALLRAFFILLDALQDIIHIIHAIALMCYVLACLYQSHLINVRTFCSACSAKSDCDQSYALPYNFNPRTRFTAPLCQACKVVITRHVVSVGQTATGASSRSRLISAGDSIARRYRVIFAKNALRKRTNSFCRRIRIYAAKYIDS